MTENYKLHPGIEMAKILVLDSKFIVSLILLKIFQLEDFLQSGSIIYDEALERSVK